MLGLLKEFMGCESWSHGSGEEKHSHGKAENDGGTNARDDGGLDARARILLWCVSFVILGQRFGVRAWEGGRAHGYE